MADNQDPSSAKPFDLDADRLGKTESDGSSKMVEDAALDFEPGANDESGTGPSAAAAARRETQEAADIKAKRASKYVSMKMEAVPVFEPGAYSVTPENRKRNEESGAADPSAAAAARRETQEAADIKSKGIGRLGGASSYVSMKMEAVPALEPGAYSVTPENKYDESADPSVAAAARRETQEAADIKAKGGRLGGASSYVSMKMEAVPALEPGAYSVAPENGNDGSGAHPSPAATARRETQEAADIKAKGGRLGGASSAAARRETQEAADVKVKGGRLVSMTKEAVPDLKPGAYSVTPEKENDESAGTDPNPAAAQQISQEAAEIKAKGGRLGRAASYGSTDAVKQRRPRKNMDGEELESAPQEQATQGAVGIANIKGGRLGRAASYGSDSVEQRRPPRRTGEKVESHEESQPKTLTGNEKSRIDGDGLNKQDLFDKFNGPPMSPKSRVDGDGLNKQDLFDKFNGPPMSPKSPKGYSEGGGDGGIPPFSDGHVEAFPVEAHLVDEEAVDAEKEEMIRKNILMEAVAADVVEDEPENHTCRNFGICCCFAILLSILLGVLLSSKDEEQEPISDYNYLVGLVSTVTEPEVLFNESSPQFQAFNWLLLEDDPASQIQTTSESVLLERYIASLVYFATNGPEWESQLGFLTNSSVCEWPQVKENERDESPGVRCNEVGSITKIALASNNLNGTLPLELGALSTLRYLGLEDNALYGMIPETIGQLAQLEVIEMAATDVSGTLPESIANLEKLRFLRARYCQLTGTIPDGLMQISRLEYLNFQYNYLTGNIPDVASFGAMEQLRLDGNLLTGPIPESICTLGDLERLTIKKNGVTGTIPTCIGRMSRITDLDFIGNALEGNLPSEIGLLEDLNYLYVGTNYLTGPIPPQLGSLKNAIELWFSSNDFTGTLPSEFGLFSGVYLWFDNTSIVGDIGPIVCGKSPPNDANADCLGEDPDIICPCCTMCCDDASGECNVDIMQICKFDAFWFEAFNGTTCDCIEIAPELQTEECRNGFCPSNVIESCNDTCEWCNKDGSVCGLRQNFGLVYDDAGLSYMESIEFQYTKGRDELLSWTQDWSGDDFLCFVAINGQECNSCITAVICGDGSYGFLIDCQNVQEGAFLNSCELQSTGGPLEYYKSLSENNFTPRLGGFEFQCKIEDWYLSF